MKKLKMNDILTSVALIVIGMLFVLYKSEVISIAMSLIGLTLIILGIVDLTRSFTMAGTVKIVLAVLILAAGWMFIKLALYLLGAFLLVVGVTQLCALANVKVKKMTLGDAIHIAQPVIYILVAICLFFNQGGALSWVFTLSGAFLIIDGFIGLVGLIDNK